METLVISIIILALMILNLARRIEKLEDYTRVKACKKILKKALKDARKNSKKQYNKIDPTCLMHGKKMSEHLCLYCCLCYKDLTPETCNVRNGKREDVCVPCAEREAEEMKKRGIER